MRVAVVQAVEDQVVVRPVLRPLGVKRLEADRRCCESAVSTLTSGSAGDRFSVFTQKEMRYWRCGWSLSGWASAAVPVLVLADALHPQRGLAAMHDLVVGKGRHALVVLKRPAVEVVAGRVLEVAVHHPRRVVRLEGGRAAVRDEQRVLGEHALHVVAVVGAAHHDGDEVEAVLLRRLPQLRRFRRRDVVGEGDAVVSVRLGARESGRSCDPPLSDRSCPARRRAIASAEPQPASRVPTERSAWTRTTRRRREARRRARRAVPRGCFGETS